MWTSSSYGYWSPEEVSYIRLLNHVEEDSVNAVKEALSDEWGVSPVMLPSVPFL